MIKHFAFSLALGLTLLLTSPTLAEDSGKSDSPAPVEQGPSMQDTALASIATVQSMLEFFFMEAGVYPADLKELATVFNYQLPKGAKPVDVPVDPASKQPFTYQVAPNKKTYRLRFPEPSQYGAVGKLELKSVDWGWLALRAERMRFEEMAKLSKHHMEVLATQLEMYAKDNKGKFPADLDALYPTYINRYPQDPITGKNYLYKQLADGYLIANPNPERYGLKLFQYSSSRGMEVEALPPESAKIQPKP